MMQDTLFRRNRQLRYNTLQIVAVTHKAYHMYESEITRFIRELHAKNPGLAAAQKQGRALLWDRPQDQSELRQYTEAHVPQQPYVYQTKV